MSKLTRLNQLLAVESNVKNECKDTLTGIYHNLKRSDGMNGFIKTYQPHAEDGEKLPNEEKIVQSVATDLIKDISRVVKERWDLEATKDATNAHAKADVVLDDGTVLLKDVHATTLLHLEKELLDMRTTFNAIPLLDTGERWSKNAELGLWESKPVETDKTKKVQKALVLVAPTDKHPGQAVQITEDVSVGVWKSVKYSGALTKDEKARKLDQLQEAIKAVKAARERANEAELVPAKIAEPLLAFILG